MAAIHDSTEAASIFSTFVSFAVGTLLGLRIGLNDAALNGTFNWTGGDLLTDTNCYPGEPSGRLMTETYAPMCGPLL